MICPKAWPTRLHRLPAVVPPMLLEYRLRQYRHRANPWPRFRLTEGQRRFAFGLVAYGTVANWFFTLLGAAFGTKILTPLAGAGYTAAQWQEAFVAGGLTSLVIAMLGSTVLFIYGLRGADGESTSPH